MASLALAFDILARDKASATFNKIGNETEKATGKVSKFGNVAKVAMGGAAIAAVAGLGAAFKGAFSDLARIEQIGAQTDAALKSTGGAAGVTRKQIDDLAGTLENLTSVEAESITEGQNLLLTFTNIQNEAGKGNDVFDQATKAMLDLSVAMKVDMKSASTLVGKALNDPVKGLSALGKAGVQFITAQKETIKAMVEMGDTAGAQKIILGELNTQFGGSAEALGGTLTGRIDILKHRFGTLMEEIAGRLLPVGEKLLEWASDDLPRAFEKVAGAVEDFMPKIVAIGRWITSNKPVLIGLSVAVGVGLAGAFAAWAVSAAAAAAATIAAAAPVIAIGAAIAALTAGVVWGYQNWDVFRGTVDGVASFLTGTVWPAIQAGARMLTETLIPAIGRVIVWFGDMIQKAMDVGRTVGRTVSDIVGFFTGLPGDLERVAGDVFGFLTSSFKNAINAVIEMWNGFELPSITIGGWDTPFGRTPSWSSPPIPFPDIPTLHAGGTVTPWGIEPLRPDEVYAKLQVGETVTPAGRGGLTIQVNEAAQYDVDALARHIAWRIG